MSATSAATRPTTGAAPGSALSCDRTTLPACRREAGRNCTRTASNGHRTADRRGVDDDPADGQVPDDVKLVRVP